MRKALKFLLIPTVLMTAAIAFCADTPEPPLAKDDCPCAKKTVKTPKLELVNTFVEAVAKHAHGRGHKLPPLHIREARHRVNWAKYGHVIKGLPKATQAAYDSYSDAGGSCVPPADQTDQDGCGDCYQWSAMKTASAAQMVAGNAKPGSGFQLSVQYMLDYHPDLGGCDGGDEYQVAQTIQSGGCPSLADYPGGGYQPGRQQPVTGKTLYTLNNIIFVSGSSDNGGIPTIQDLKNAILQYKYVSVAGAAGSDWDNISNNGTLTGNSRDIDHAIGFTGWDDNHDNGDGSKGAFITDNQWGKSWAGITVNGKVYGDRVWAKYSPNGMGASDSLGTEAFVTVATGPPAPPQPTPPGPTPVPPTPVPPTPPAPTSGFSGTVTSTYTGGTLINISVTPAASK